MKSPFYENGSFQLQSRAGLSRLQIKPSGSEGEMRAGVSLHSNDQWLSPSSFGMSWSVSWKKPLHCTRSRAALNKMSAKEETIQAASFGVLEEAVDFMKKAHELMNQQALDLRQEKEAFESVAKKLDH